MRDFLLGVGVASGAIGIFYLGLSLFIRKGKSELEYLQEKLTMLYCEYTNVEYYLTKTQVLNKFHNAKDVKKEIRKFKEYVKRKRFRKESSSNRRWSPKRDFSYARE
jgi:hypothetical protein